jgi:hypothetical protein
MAAMADVELPAVMSMLPAFSASKAGAAAGKGPAARFRQRDVVRAAQPADPDHLVGGLYGRDEARACRHDCHGGKECTLVDHLEFQSAVRREVSGL